MKKALSFLLIFVVLFSFAGCSGDDSGKKKSEKLRKSNWNQVRCSLNSKRNL